jgi:hypothetical protein
MPEIQLHQYMYQLSQLLQQLYPIHDPKVSKEITFDIKKYTYDLVYVSELHYSSQQR